jgi:hypothetical protein
MHNQAELKTVATIERVQVVLVLDEDADLSWLEQECWNDRQEGSTLPDEGKDFGLNRIADYNHGLWWMVGVQAAARVSFTTNGITHCHEFTTPGLWGTESDSGADHFREVGAEELFTLRQDLAALGLDFDDSEVEWNLTP